MSARHYLITGGCGFIGSHIAEELVNQQEQVTIFDNLSTGKLENIDGFKDRVNLIIGDICDYKLLLQSMSGITHVFHEAANVSVFDSVERPHINNEINITGTLNVLRCAADNGAKRIVMASSCAIYGNDPALPKVETMKPAPASPYAVSKITDEYYLSVFSALYGIEAVSLRYFNVYGPRQDPSSPYSGVISIFATCAIDGHKPHIFGDGCQTRDFVYVKDVVQANLLAMHNQEVGQGEVFNIGTGQTTSLLDLLHYLRDITDADLTPVFNPARPGDVLHSQADISLAADRLNYSPRFSLQNGLEELIYWMQNAH